MYFHVQPDCPIYRAGPKIVDRRGGWRGLGAEPSTGAGRALDGGNFGEWHAADHYFILGSQFSDFAHDRSEYAWKSVSLLHLQTPVDGTYPSLLPWSRPCRVTTVNRGSEFRSLIYFGQWDALNGNLSRGQVVTYFLEGRCYLYISRVATEYTVVYSECERWLCLV